MSDICFSPFDMPAEELARVREAWMIVSESGRIFVDVYTPMPGVSVSYSKAVQVLSESEIVALVVARLGVPETSARIYVRAIRQAEREATAGRSLHRYIDQLGDA